MVENISIPEVIFLEKNPLRGQGFYSKRDMAIEYFFKRKKLDIKNQKLSDKIDGILRINRHDKICLIFDTLTITVKHPTGEFLALDAYTNKDQWIIEKDLSVPGISFRGTLIFKNLPKDDDRFSFPIIPLYSSVQEYPFLVIHLTSIRPDLYIECGGNLLAGVYKEGTKYKLAEFWLLNLLHIS